MEGRVLITGPRGFVGRHLAAELGERAVGTTANVLDAEAVRSAVASTRPNALVHLAARSSVAASWHGATDVWSVNLLGTVNVLSAVRAERPEARVVFVSSGEVYGRAESLPVTEDAPISPLSPYAASKAAGEIACELARRSEGLKVVVARPFAHIGPGQGDQFAVGSWTLQLARAELAGRGTLRVGDLSMQRDFTDVRDVCRAYGLMLDTRVPLDIYNVASGRPTALSDVVEILLGLVTCPIGVERDPSLVRREDIDVLSGEASRLEGATGWRPTIELERTLADALEEARRIVRSGEAATA